MAQRALYCDEGMPELAHVFVITTTGTVLQGDRFALDVSVGEGAHAHVTTQSATKIHSMDANYAAQTQTFSLADGAYLEVLPDPLIPHREARYIADTRIIIAPSRLCCCRISSSRGESIIGTMRSSELRWFPLRRPSLGLRARLCSVRNS